VLYELDQHPTGAGRVQEGDETMGSGARLRVDESNAFRIESGEF
jgi:hypothetical protein